METVDKISFETVVSTLLGIKESMSSIYKGELSREQEETKSLIDKSIDVAIAAIYQIKKPKTYQDKLAKVQEENQMDTDKEEVQ